MKKENELTIHHIFWYFLIFSILGLLIETIYCYVTMGIIESRKGLIWGPFCPVYGVSATVLILFLNRYKDKNIFQLFIYGAIVGSISEYVLSFGLETIYSMRFWDYNYLKFNLNGRVCIQYSIYWGILSVILMKFIKPIIDYLVNKMQIKIRNIIEIILFIFLVINCMFTVWGIQTYENRVLGKEKAYNNVNNFILQIKENIEENYFTNDRMSRTFPNLRIKDENENEIWIKALINKEESK